jgi:hypothetical protein
MTMLPTYYCVHCGLRLWEVWRESADKDEEILFWACPSYTEFSLHSNIMSSPPQTRRIETNRERTRNVR